MVLPECQLLVLALDQSAAGSGCESGSWGFETKHRPDRTLLRAGPEVFPTPLCPSPTSQQFPVNTKVISQLSWVDFKTTEVASSKNPYVAYLGILQVLNVSSAVAVLHSSRKNPEAFSSYCVHYWTSIREEMDTPDDQHATIICKSKYNNSTFYSEMHSSDTSFLEKSIFYA